MTLICVICVTMGMNMMLLIFLKDLTLPLHPGKTFVFFYLNGNMYAIKMYSYYDIVSNPKADFAARCQMPQLNNPNYCQPKIALKKYACITLFSNL